jgi:DNA-binding transcriptional LysR family regulator
VDWEDLRAFRAVVEHGSFTAAAEALRIARPGLSRRVARLERQLGAPLFVRTTRRVELTDAGRALLDGTDEISAVWATTVGAVQASGERQRSAPQPPAELTIGFASVSNARSINRLTTRFPGTRWRSEQVTVADAVRRMSEGLLDVFFGNLLPGVEIPPCDDARFLLLMEQPAGVGMATGHWAATQAELRVADLAAERWIMDNHPDIRDAETRMCRNAGFEPDTAHVLADMTAVRNLVISGQAITWTTGALPRSDEYVVRLPVDAPRVRLMIGWTPRRVPRPVAVMLADDLLTLYLEAVVEHSPQLTAWLARRGTKKVKALLAGMLPSTPA